jgi:hypothetical protein
VVVAAEGALIVPEQGAVAREPPEKMFLDQGSICLVERKAFHHFQRSRKFWPRIQRILVAFALR